ncbi:AbrB family transcriptional regulator [Chelatococcus sp. SYSU_G07232]|uniref:AbrB family transcriptional regulator n=1 Tax=Chelatococcus albus TaxID=3047466 RepID=A0ABT7AF15_9HYPH|nr:AbrB family transcriptional regulator [Chelatococcus sp. SYSU_G07232]MDJ1157968.1 AbrB family transcriptional regulator [Chelatococcus sp. SYSU_G07232]
MAGPGPNSSSLLRQVVQTAVAAAGGYLFSLAGVPAAWLSGAVVAVALLCAVRRAVAMPPGLSDAAMLLAGVSMGGAATPEALGAFARYPASLGLLALSVVVVVLLSGAWLTRLAGWSRIDAMLGSAPGALSTVMAVAADRGARIGPIAVVQSFRLAVLVVVLPSVVFAIDGGRPLAAVHNGDMSPAALGLVLLGGLIFGTLLKRIGMAAPMLLGATLVSAVAHACGWVRGALPGDLGIFALILLGAFIGTRFRTVDRPSLVASLPAALGSFAVSGVVAALFAVAAAEFARVPFGAALVAFAPGGLEAMTVLALVLGLDPIYVGAHHLARFLGIGVALPLAASWLARRGGPAI